MGDGLIYERIEIIDFEKNSNMTRTLLIEIRVGDPNNGRIMPSLPKNLAAIRNATASILRSAGHVGHLYSASNIATILRITAGVDNNETVGIDVDSHLVVRAFSFEQQNEYSLPYEDYVGYAGNNHVLYHRTSGQESRRA